MSPLPLFRKYLWWILLAACAVLAALFELADREFRQIRDSTEAELKAAPDETANEQPEGGPEQPGQAPAIGAELNAFTFLKIATHFFRGFEFEPHKVDGFVEDINEWDTQITRSKFNFHMKQSISVVKRYKVFFEERNATDKLNPYTVIRHCLSVVSQRFSEERELLM